MIHFISLLIMNIDLLKKKLSWLNFFYTYHQQLHEFVSSFCE